MSPREATTREIASMQRFRFAVSAVSFGWSGAATVASEHARKGFDIQVFDQDGEVTTRLTGLTRHELDVASSVLEGLDRAARKERQSEGIA